MNQTAATTTTTTTTPALGLSVTCFYTQNRAIFLSRLKFKAIRSVEKASDASYALLQKKKKKVALPKGLSRLGLKMGRVNVEKVGEDGWTPYLEWRRGRQQRFSLTTPVTPSSPVVSC